MTAKRRILPVLVAILVAIAMMPVSAVMVYADDTTHTVTFNTYGRCETPAAQTVAHGAKAVRPEHPADREKSADFDTTDLRFRCWSVFPPEELTYDRIVYNFGEIGRDGTEGGKFDFSTPIEGDITLHALYEGNLNLCVYNVTNSSYYPGGKLRFCSEYNGYDGSWFGSGGSAEIAGTQITVQAQPDPGYRFLGWSVDKTTDGIISTEADYSFTFEKSVMLYGMFEEVQASSLDVHWSSVDGTDLMDPMTLKYTSGMTLKQALEANGLDMDSEVFAKDGYDGKLHVFTSKPITEYTDSASLKNASLGEDYVLTEDTDLYYSMLKHIDAAELTVKAPVCGTSTAVPEGGDPLADQTNPPEITVPEGTHYAPYANEAQHSGVWTTSEGSASVYQGAFKGGEKYYAVVYLLPDLGYSFRDDISGIKVNGGEVINKEISGSSLAVRITVTADHDWDAGVVTKEATTAETGEKVYKCKVCDAEKTETTPKLEKKDNPLSVKGKPASVKYSKLKKKSQTLPVTKVITFKKKINDKKTYTLSAAKKKGKSFKKYFKISKSTGKVTVKKGLKKGTYKVTVKVKALGNSDYKASGTKTVTFTVKVR